MNKPTETEIIDTLVILLNTRYEFSLQIPDNLIEKCSEMCEFKKRNFTLAAAKGGHSGKTLTIEKVQKN